MDVVFTEFAAQFIVAAVILCGLVVVYIDLRKRMDKADAERQQLLDYVLDNTRRTKLIERESTGDISPTLPKRPIIES